MNRFPPIAKLTPESSGWGFFLCARKEVRAGRHGDSLMLLLQDRSGQIAARVAQDVDVLRQEFDAGEFVKVVGRAGVFRERLELAIEKVRRVYDGDRANGFREEDCIPSAPRPLDEMWRELTGLVEREVRDRWVRDLLERALDRFGGRLRIWPAAQGVHHAYRGGLLEHVLTMAEAGVFLARAYEANPDLVVAGVVLHDIGKLEELEYDAVAQYSTAGNLLGHIVLGAQAVNRLITEIEGFPESLRVQIEHLVLSHHGSREFGSPVEPMTLEAFIVAAVDDLDAKVHQVRRHLAEDESEGDFTAYHPRLRRVLFKPSGR